MAYNISPLIGVDFSTTFSDLDDVANAGRTHALGEIVLGSDGSEWQFVKATTALTQYDTVWVNTAGEAAPITAALCQTPGKPAFAQVGFTVNYYGWVCTRGPVTLRVAALCAKNVPLYTTDTAGVLDDAVASLSHYQVMGTVISTTGTAGGVNSIAGNAAYPMIRRPVA